MSPNTNLSEKIPSTFMNGEPLDNNSSTESHSIIKKQDSKDDKITKTIIITKHLCNPCPIRYVDYFKSVSIVCKDPSHTKSADGKKVTIRDLSQNLSNMNHKQGVIGIDE